MQRQYQTVENRDVVAERSIVEADFYARRFKEFLFERVFHPAEQLYHQLILLSIRKCLDLISNFLIDKN
jgi:hypothetical protein